MLHQDRAEPADFIVQTSNSLLQPLVLHRELLDLLLELAKPRLLALSTLERGCGLALLILPPLMLMLTLPVPLKEVLALVLLRLGLAVVAALITIPVIVTIKVGRRALQFALRGVLLPLLSALRLPRVRLALRARRAGRGLRGPRPSIGRQVRDSPLAHQRRGHSALLFAFRQLLVRLREQEQPVGSL